MKVYVVGNKDDFDSLMIKLNKNDYAWWYDKRSLTEVEYKEGQNVIYHGPEGYYASDKEYFIANYMGMTSEEIRIIYHEANPENFKEDEERYIRLIQQKAETMAGQVWNLSLAYDMLQVDYNRLIDIVTSMIREVNFATREEEPLLESALDLKTWVSTVLETKEPSLDKRLIEEFSVEMSNQEGEITRLNKLVEILRSENAALQKEVDYLDTILTGMTAGGQGPFRKE